MPDEHGEWNRVFRCYRQWTTTGLFDAMLEPLGKLDEGDGGADMIGTTAAWPAFALTVVVTAAVRWTNYCITPSAAERTMTR